MARQNDRKTLLKRGPHSAYNRERGYKIYFTVTLQGMQTFLGIYLRTKKN